MLANTNSDANWQRRPTNGIDHLLVEAITAANPSIADRLCQPELQVITKMNGGAKRDRTADLLHAMQALSQLSYSPISKFWTKPDLGFR